MESEPYNLGKAQEEAQKLTKKVKSGEASNYTEAERQVGQEAGFRENIESQQKEAVLHQKISVIEKIPADVISRSQANLVLIGAELATEILITNKDDAPKAVEDLRSIGLFAEISDKPRLNQERNSTYILVAYSQTILDELKQTYWHTRIEEDKVLHQKISVIEKIPASVDSRSMAILVLLGVKLASEIYINKENDAPKAVEDLRSTGLFAEISEKPILDQDRGSAIVLVARSQGILDELKQTYGNKDHRRYGELMGYPRTAIDAFVGDNRAERLPSWEQEILLDDLPTRISGIFVFSKKHKHKELAFVKRVLKLLAQEAPELFYDLYEKKLAEKFIKKALECK